jgi:hypothetical protein
MILPWRVNGDVCLADARRTSQVPEALRLQDLGLSAARRYASWHTEQNWMPWMKMDNHACRLMGCWRRGDALLLAALARRQ